MIFVDSNYFIHLLTHHEKQSKIETFFDEKQDLCTSMTVLNEVKYGILWYASSKKLKTTKKYEIISHLKSNDPLLSEIMERYITFFINIRASVIIYGSTAEDELLTCDLMTKYGFLPSDASILATMIHNNISTILTDDEDFKKVKEINVLTL